MANSVGSVSIDLEARIAKFESDLGRAARVAEQRSNEMRKTLGAVAGALGAGLSIVGITAWIKGAVDAQDAISKMSQKVAVSTETLSGWQLAAKQAGVENESLQKGLVKLGQSAALAVEGSKLQANAFKSIGVSATDASGHLKSTQVLFEQVADKISKYKDSTEKTVVATRLFGKAGADLIPLLNAGKQGLADYIKMADDFGLTVGGKSAKAAEAFNDSMEQLGFVSKGVANQLATSLAPAMADLADKAVAFFRSQNWKSVLNDISTGAKYVADHVGDIINAVKLLGEVIATVYATKAILWGTRWVGNLTAQSAAIAANGVAMQGFGAITVASFSNAVKSIGLLGVAFNVLGSAVVGWQIGKYLSDQFLDVRLAGIALVDGLLTAWERVKEGALIAWAALSAGFDIAMSGVKASAAAAIQVVAQLLLIQGNVAQYQQFTAYAKSIDTSTDSVAKFSGAVAEITAQTDKNIASIHANTSGMADYEIAQEAAKNTTAKHIPIIAEQGKALGIVNENATNAAKALGAYTQKLADLQHAQSDTVAKYVNKIEPPDVQAWNAYGEALTAVNDNYEKQVNLAKAQAAAGVTGINVAKVEAEAQKQLANSLEALGNAYDVAAVAAERKKNVGSTMAADAIQQANIAALSARDQAIANAGLQTYNTLIAQGEDANGSFVASQVAIAEQGAATAYDLTKYAQQQQATAQEYAGYWENAASSIAKSFGDLFTGQIRSFKDFGNSLKSIAQQFVSDMISTFLRMRVLGPIMAGVMGYLGQSGGSGSVLSLVSQYYGGGAVAGESPSSTGGAGGGTGSYSGMLSNISTMKSLYSYVMGGGSAGTGAGNVASVGVDSSGHATAFNPWANPSSGSYYGGMGSVGGYAVPYASVAGGLAGAYYGSRQGDGSLGTVGSTFAYGALGAGIAGTAAGIYGGMGVGAAAYGAFGGTAAAAGAGAGAAGTAVGASGAAAAATGLSWVPIVGWVAALAALVDHFSGGKVFGTKYQTNASDVSLNIGPDGSSADASVQQWKYRSQLSQAFGRVGGILLPSDWGDKDRQFKDVAATPEMTAAAKALYDNIEKVMVTGAQKLGVDVPSMLEASLSAQSTYDKKGKLKSTDYVVEYLGRTWKEATADAAAQRIGAEALVNVVAQSAGSVAQSIAEQFRASAETLLDGAQLMLAAQADIKKGNNLVALGASATLATVIAFTQTLQADGEKLADTYNRLVQASAAYLQFVGQFAPVSTGFGASLQAIAKQMQANIDQANALAQAAGLQHAKESDLANIHQFAANAAAEAIAQLSSAAQDLAGKLYTVTGSSLAAVNALLDKMTGKVQTAAQLAIGDNSPLNDKEKLDVALKGLRSGITSADDVLGLGRKLYASSADYAGLYAKVQDILQLPGAGETGTSGINKALDDYNKLIGQRDQYQSQADAMARFGDAKTLAQYVADISTTHGIGYGEAASGLGFSLADLAKDLGVTNLTGYLDNLKLADIPGSTMDASASIVDAIQQLGRDLIQTITGGPLVLPGPTSGTKATPDDPQTVALLQQLAAHLASINQSSAQTAATNTAMVKQGTTDELRTVAGSNRKNILVAE